MYEILLGYVAILSCTLFRCYSADSPRPLIIALPIRLHPSMMPPPFSMKPEDRENEDSEEERPREQRIVHRTYKSASPESRLPQQQEEEEEEEASNSNPRSNFLTWNPGNKFMVLQINDFIGGRNQESDESEESEKVEEQPMLTKPGQHYSYQGNYDFESAGDVPPNPPLPPNFYDEMQRNYRNTSKSRRKKKKKDVANYSVEDTESGGGGGVYGTDPVVHFLKNRYNKKNTGEHFDFGEMGEMPPNADEDEFGNWWKY